MSNLKVIFGFDVLAHTAVDFFKSLLLNPPEVRLSTVSSLLSVPPVFQGATLFLSDYS